MSDGITDAYRESRDWGEARKSCECSTWCRAEPQPITDKHHKKCHHYDDKIRVVRIEHGGSSYYDKSIKSALEALDDCCIGDVYTVEIMEMIEREYDALPEFQGF